MPRALTALTLLAACAELTGPSSSIDPADTFAVWARDHGDALISVCHSLETSAQAQRQGSPRFVILDGDGPDARAWVGWEFRSAADGPRDATNQGWLDAPSGGPPHPEAFAEVAAAMRQHGLRSVRLRTADIPGVPYDAAYDERRKFVGCEVRRAADADGAAFASAWIAVGGGPWWQMGGDGKPLETPRATCSVLRANPPDTMWACRWPTPAADVRAGLQARDPAALDAIVDAALRSSLEVRLTSLDDADPGYTWVPLGEHASQGWTAARVHQAPGATAPAWVELFPLLTYGPPYRDAPRLVRLDAPVAPERTGACAPLRPQSRWAICDGPLAGTPAGPF